MEPMTAESDLGIGRRPSPLDAHPMENGPSLKRLHKGAMERGGGGPQPNFLRDGLGGPDGPFVTQDQYLERFIDVLGRTDPTMLTPDLLRTRFEQLQAAVIDGKVVDETGADQVMAVITSRIETLDTNKSEGGTVARKVETNGAITESNWLSFARRLLNSDGPPVAGYGIYGQMDEVAEGITVGLEALARSLEERGERLEVAGQIRATVHLRHCAYAFKGLPPIKLIKDRLEKFVLLDASKSRLLTGGDLELLHREGIPGLHVNEALDLLRTRYMSGDLSTKGITDADRQNIYRDICSDLRLEERSARLSLDYALNIGWATGLIAEWDIASRRATNLSKLYFFRDYRVGESDVSDGGLMETKGLVLYLPPGSFYRNARISRPAGDFVDAEGALVTGKNRFLVDPKPDKPTMYDPFFYAPVSTVEAAQRFALRRQTGWWIPGDGIYGNLSYRPIDYDELDFASLPTGSYETWVKNIRRASTVAGYLLTSFWSPGDLTSDKLAEMHSLISELDPSRSCRLQTAIVITVLMSINKEGLDTGAWKTAEVTKFLGNCLKPIGVKEQSTNISFVTQKELEAAVKVAGELDQRGDLISGLLRIVPPGRLRTILDASVRSYVQKVGGKFATTGTGR